MPITNIGSGEIKEVADRKLPTKLDPERKRSAAEGQKGIGPNEQCFCDDQEDFAMGVDTEGKHKAHIEQPMATSKPGARNSF